MSLDGPSSIGATLLPQVAGVEPLDVRSRVRSAHTEIKIEILFEARRYMEFGEAAARGESRSAMGRRRCRRIKFDRGIRWIRLGFGGAVS